MQSGLKLKTEKKMNIPIISNLIAKAAGDITESITGAIDSTLTSDEEKLSKKNEITAIVTARLSEVISYQKDILTTEMQGSSLQRNWRPIVMLAFAFIVVYRYFIAPVFHLELIDMPDQFWTLLEFGIGGYVVGRSLEKVTDTVTKNIDIPFLKRKNRNLK